jgi:acyl dehydratase
MAATVTRQELEGRIGQQLGVSDWFLVDQSRVNDFADVTLDHQFIHVDVERARTTPFGGTIAHGFLTLSLLVHLCLPFIPTLENRKLVGSQHRSRSANVFVRSASSVRSRSANPATSS